MSTSTVANIHTKLTAVKAEAAQAKVDYEAAEANTLAKQAIVDNMTSTTSDADRASNLSDLVTATKAGNVCLLELRAKEVEVGQLETQLKVEEQLVRDGGRINSSTGSTGDFSTPIDAASISALGISSVPERTTRDGDHAVIFEKSKREADAKSRKIVDDDIQQPWKTPLSVGYSSPTKANAGYAATQYIQNQELIAKYLPGDLCRYDLGGYQRVLIPSDPTETDPQVSLVGGSSVNIAAQSGVLSTPVVAASARIMHDHTKHGDSDDQLLMKFAKRISDEPLYEAVKRKFDELPEDQHYGQVFLFMIIREATVLGEATLTTMVDWVKQKGLCTQYDGDISKLVKVIKAVTQVLLQYGKMPHQLGKHLLTEFGANKCEEFAAPFSAMLLDYVKEHALENKGLGWESQKHATKHYRECLDILKTGELLFNQEVQAGNYVVAGGKPSSKSFNAFAGTGDDDGWEPEHRWYPTKEFNGLTPGQRKKVRQLIKKRGPPDDAPEEFKQKFANNQGGYQRKSTWAKGAPGRNSSTAKSLRQNGGVAWRDGKLMLWCKDCGVNDSHTSGGHGQWASNPGSYCLPAGHPGKALQIKHLGTAGNSSSNEPSNANLQTELKQMKEAFKQVATLSTKVLEAEAEEDPDPTCASNRRALVGAWKKWLN